MGLIVYKPQLFLIFKDVVSIFFNRTGKKLLSVGITNWERPSPPTTIMQKNKILSFFFTIQVCLYVNLRPNRLYGLLYPLIK